VSQPPTRPPAAPPSGSAANPRWKHLSGAAAEDLVARHLEANGCAILARRYRRRGGEVDLVVRDGAVIAFVEVKARRGSRYGTAVEAVTARKRLRIVRAARQFLAEQGLRSSRCRFDVACVEIAHGRAKVRWLRDAFRA